MEVKKHRKRVKKSPYVLIVGAVIIAGTVALLGGFTIQAGVFIIGLIIGIKIGLRK